MKKQGGPLHDPVPIGDVALPDFVRLPEPRELFARRGARYRRLAGSHPLEAYLKFLAALADVQHGIQDGLPDLEPPDADAMKRAREFGMPPLDRYGFRGGEAFERTLDRLLGGAQDIAMPEAARGALERIAQADVESRADMANNVLSDSIPVEALAEHAFLAAALQVHFARLASLLDPKTLTPVGDGVCPSCGGPPVSSVVVGWRNALGSRYCVCALCGSFWNYVRIKCALCASTKGIAYQEVDGGAGAVKAETCEECRGYVKILHQVKDPSLDPVADDVASLGLDMLVRERGYRRGGFNPFLLGY